MEPDSILNIRDLHVTFRGPSEAIAAVRGISFVIRKGETVGIIGESGSGKSVTSLAIQGLIPEPGYISRGSLHFRTHAGETIDLAHFPDKQFQKIRGKEIAMIFQDPNSSLNPVFRCGEQVLESILLHHRISQKVARERVLSLFRQVQFEDPERIYHSFPHQLSGGQKQRVMIAMALSGNPSLLIADEPTSALDVTVQKSILELFKKLQQDWGGSVLFISHDLGVISEMAERVLVMYQGEIVEEGTVQDIFRRPKHSYTRRLIDDYIEMRRVPSAGSSVENARPILEVRQLSTWFPARKTLFGKVRTFMKAVDNISLDVFEGETLGLVGESGSGKTTLGRSLLFLQKPTSGLVVYNGQNLYELPGNQWKSFRKEMQIIFQDPYASLDPRQRAGEAVLEPMKVHGLYESDQKRKEKVLELLHTVGLESAHFERFPHEFSGGQRQRICIARALALEPSFIVCDECVSALDVSIQSQILSLLKKLQKERNITYIFISHDLSVVRKISDRIAVMKNGRIVESGPSEQICNRPENTYTRQLLEAIPGKFIPEH